MVMGRLTSSSGVSLCSAPMASVPNSTLTAIAQRGAPVSKHGESAHRCPQGSSGRMRTEQALVHTGGLRSAPVVGRLASFRVAALMQRRLGHGGLCSNLVQRGKGQVTAFMTEGASWFVRVWVYYALIQIGVAGGGIVSQGDSAGITFLNMVKGVVLGDAEAKAAKARSRSTIKWKESTKGTLVRRTRVASKQEGKRLLQRVCDVLSDDDTFRDMATHKGCQIRRETAHSESVCCKNVRALFDENPTPRLEIEITVFPAGPITASEYAKAEALEKVLKGGHFI